MSEPTKEELTALLQTWKFSCERLCEKECNVEFMEDECKPCFYAIRSLIENQPRVKRSNMEAIIENVKTGNAENMDALLNYLEAKGVAIEEEDWEKEASDD